MFLIEITSISLVFNQSEIMSCEIIFSWQNLFILVNKIFSGYFIKKKYTKMEKKTK